MKAKIIFIITALLFCSPSVFAQTGGSGPANDLLIDNAGLLSATEYERIESRLESASRAYNFDLVIVTEESIGSASPRDYADDFFDYNGYGQNSGRDGCLFLIVSGSRDYWFSSSGRGIGILNETAFNKLEKDALALLSENDYAGAFNAFIDNWNEFLALDAKGRNYNFFHERRFLLAGIAWIAALIIGFAVVMAWKAKLNTVLPAMHAAAYMVPGSLNFRESRDRYLYSTVTKIKRETQSSGSSGGLHKSSSGRSHGGGGGKY